MRLSLIKKGVSYQRAALLLCSLLIVAFEILQLFEIYKVESTLSQLNSHNDHNDHNNNNSNPLNASYTTHKHWHRHHHSTQPKSFPWNNQSGCQSWPPRRQHHDRPAGLVISLIHGTGTQEESSNLQKHLLCHSLPSQLTHLVGPQEWDMLLLLSGDHFRDVTFEQISNCLNLVEKKGQDDDKDDDPTQPRNNNEKVWQNLDGTNLTTVEYRWDNRVSIFLARVQIDWPHYIQDDMSILNQTIEPAHLYMCNAPKAYIQGTRWYTHEMLNLGILQNYHWFIKLDLDVYFVRTVEWSLLHDLQTRNSIFAHAAEYPVGEGLGCAGNIVQAVKDFVNETAGLTCACDTENPSLKVDRDFYHTNFIIGRVDFWTQAIVRELGRYLTEYSAGYFKHRWTDQVFWGQALGMLVLVNEAAVTDYSDLRCSPERNCWAATFAVDLYGIDASLQCENDGYFVHAKHPNYAWNRTVTHSGQLWKSNWEVRPLAYKNECPERLARKRNEMTTPPPPPQKCQPHPSRQHNERPKGLVTTLILTPDTNMTKTFMRRMTCHALPSQLIHLVGPQQWDVLLVMGSTHSTQETLLSFDYIIECLDLKQAEKDPVKVWKNFDGSTLTTTEYRWDNRVSVFLSEVQLEWPQYIQRNMSILERTIEPADLCDTPKSYIQGTRWYTHEMLNLGILQEYQWFIKLDIDVIFVRTVEWSLLHDLQTRNSVFAHTAEYPLTMGAECSVNIVRAMQDFVRDTKDEGGGAVLSGYCDDENPKLKLDRDFYYTNFIIGRVDFWTQPTMRRLGRYLSEYPQGFFHHRWTDQIFWAQALGLLLPLKNDVTVTDYTELRCSIERNCWQAIFYYHIYQYGAAVHDMCENGGYFVHTKNAKLEWNRTPSHTGKLWRGSSNTEVHPLSYKDECQERLWKKHTEMVEKNAREAKERKQ